MVRSAAILLVLWMMGFAGSSAGATPASPAVSTPPGKLVFSSNRDGDFEIYKINADGSDLTKLTDNDHRDSDPVWSPDGRKILFVRRTTSLSVEALAAGTTEMESVQKLYIMNADGSEERRLTDKNHPHEARYETLASFSPDGSKILFTRSTPDPFSHPDLYIIDVDGSDEKHIGPYNLSQDAEAIWSPDGQTILFIDSAELWIRNADGSPHASGEPNRRLTDVLELATSPDYSADGASIAFDGDLDGDFEIFVMAQDGTDRQQVTHNEVEDFDPAWSPDGATMVFSRESPSGDSILNNHDLWLVDLQTSQERLIVEGVSPFDTEFFMGNDWIAVQRRVSEDERDIEVFAVDGSTAYVLADSAASDELGSWHPDRISNDVTRFATESPKSLPWPLESPDSWPLAAIEAVGAIGVCAGAWYWRRRKRSAVPSP